MNNLIGAVLLVVSAVVGFMVGGVVATSLVGLTPLSCGDYDCNLLTLANTLTSFAFGLGFTYLTVRFLSSMKDHLNG